MNPTKKESWKIQYSTLRNEESLYGDSKEKVIKSYRIATRILFSLGLTVKTFCLYHNDKLIAEKKTTRQEEESPPMKANHHQEKWTYQNFLQEEDRKTTTTNKEEALREYLDFFQECFENLPPETQREMITEWKENPETFQDFFSSLTKIYFESEENKTLIQEEGELTQEEIASLQKKIETRI